MINFFELAKTGGNIVFGGNIIQTNEMMAFYSTITQGSFAANSTTPGPYSGSW